MGLRRILLLFTTVSMLHASAVPVVKTANGEIKGTQLNVYGNKVHAFLGIPYAKPPLRDLRFQRPLPKEPWLRPRLAKSFRKRCMQEVPLELSSEPNVATHKMGEDCLYLNVWSPISTNHSKAVLVWIHGGDFKEGSSDDPFFDGSVLAATQDVVVVSFNYRLGFLGFLNAVNANAPGNAGLYDQILALTWVKNNIHAFMGNDSQITLFGENVGSVSIRLHMMSPVAGGLFQRVILQGGGPYTFKGYESVSKGLLKANALAVEVGCSKGTHSLVTHPQDVIECLKSRTAQEIVNAQAELRLQGIEPALATYGTEFLPQNPDLIFDLKGFSNVQVLTGHDSAEGRRFISSVFEDRFEILRKHKNMTIDDFSVALHVLLNTLGYRRPVASNIVKHCMKNVVHCDSAVLVQAVDRCAALLGVICPSISFARKLAAADMAVYYYAINYATYEAEGYLNNHLDHVMETPFAFGSPMRFPGKFEESDRSFSEKIMRSWAEFAKQGKPSTSDGLTWPQFKEGQPYYVELSSSLMLLKQMDTSVCELIKKS